MNLNEPFLVGQVHQAPHSTARPARIARTSVTGQRLAATGLSLHLGLPELLVAAPSLGRVGIYSGLCLLLACDLGRMLCLGNRTR